MNEAALVRDHAGRQPDALAVLWEDERWTYAELDERLRRLTGGLRSLGVEPGDRVLVALPNQPEFPLLTHATWRLGGVHMPVNPRSSDAELEGIVGHSDPTVAVVQTGHVAILRELQREHTRLRIVSTGNDGDISLDKLLASESDDTCVPLDSDELAVIAYTSGTTGNPKGVMLSHYNCATAMNMLAHVQVFGLDDNILQVLPCSSIACSLSGVLLGWHLGARSSLLAAFEPVSFAKFVGEVRPTFFGSVPTMYHDLLATAPTIDFSSVRFVTFGGAPSAETLKQTVFDRFGLKMVQSYGMTEAPLIFVIDPCDWPMRGRGIGIPLPHVVIDAVDDSGRVVGPQETGEIRVRAADSGEWSGVYKLFLGYWHNEEATKAAIVDGHLHTGDLGRVDEEGVVHFVGRKKELIIRGGNNIVPSELEALLLADDRVDEAYVIGVPDERLGEVPKAFAVVRPGLSATREELLELVNTKVSPYKRVEDLVIIDPGALPRTSMGKVIKHRLEWPS